MKDLLAPFRAPLLCFSLRLLQSQLHLTGLTWKQQFLSLIQDHGVKPQQDREDSSSLKRAGLIPRGLFTIASPADPSGRVGLLAEAPPPQTNHSEPPQQKNASPAVQAEFAGDFEPSGRDLIGVRFESDSAGWIVAADASLYHTADGGQTWNQDFGAEFIPTWVRLLAEGAGYLNVTDLILMANGQGWATTSLGVASMERDGGWKALCIGSKAGIFGIDFLEPGTGMAVGGNGTVLPLGEKRREWNERPLGPGFSSYAVDVFDGDHAWVAGDSGTVAFTRNGDVSWIEGEDPIPGTIGGLSFGSGSNGCAVTYSGIDYTRDGGTRWRPAETEPRGKGMRALTLIDAANGWASTDQGILRSTGGGGNWHQVRPITPEDPDPLEFQTVAEGFAQFIRNENAKPPLTIAIAKGWGSGKSSLMNLLCEGLVQIGFRPVWFNAWHHQTEKHMIAALLENIRTRAIPHWLRFEGFVFRFNLLAGSVSGVLPQDLTDELRELFSRRNT